MSFRRVLAVGAGVCDLDRGKLKVKPEMEGKRFEELDRRWKILSKLSAIPEAGFSVLIVAEADMCGMGLTKVVATGGVRWVP